jgi:hypothetical protein
VRRERIHQVKRGPFPEARTDPVEDAPRKPEPSETAQRADALSSLFRWRNQDEMESGSRWNEVRTRIAAAAALYTAIHFENPGIGLSLDPNQRDRDQLKVMEGGCRAGCLTGRERPPARRLVDHLQQRNRPSEARADSNEMADRRSREDDPFDGKRLAGRNFPQIPNRSLVLKWTPVFDWIDCILWDTFFAQGAHLPEGFVDECGLLS